MYKHLVMGACVKLTAILHIRTQTVQNAACGTTLIVNVFIVLSINGVTNFADFV